MSEKDIIPGCQVHALLTLADVFEKFDFQMQINFKDQITITSGNLSLVEALAEINASELRKLSGKIFRQEDP